MTPVTRVAAFNILMGQIRATGLTGSDLNEVERRLRLTETTLLVQMCEQDCVGQAVRRAARAIGTADAEPKAQEPPAGGKA